MVGGGGGGGEDEVSSEGARWSAWASLADPAVDQPVRLA